MIENISFLLYEYTIFSMNSISFENIELRLIHLIHIFYSNFKNKIIGLYTFQINCRYETEWADF